MLQAVAAGLRASSALAPAVGCSTTWTTLQRALYSTAPPAEPAPAPAKPKEGDYSLVMAQAAQLATECASAPLPPGEGGVTFGVPLETFKRKAIVTSLARVAGQQGVGNTLENAAAPAWRIEFEARAKWQNPLQGWNSTADPLENVGRSSLFFFTKEQAVAYAQKAGWEVEVVEPQVRRKDRQKRFNSYGDNYTTKRKGLPDLTHLSAYAAHKK